MEIKTVFNPKILVETSPWMIDIKSPINQWVVTNLHHLKGELLLHFTISYFTYVMFNNLNYVKSQKKNYI